MTIVLLSLIGLIVYLYYLLRQERIQLARYQDIIDVEAKKANIESQIATLNKDAQHIQKTNENLVATQNDLNAKIKTAKSELEVAISDVEVQEFGIYKPKYDFGASETYKERLTLIRERQKHLLKSDQAILGGQGWTVNGDAKKGKKMIDEQKKLMLRAFNGECDSIISKVKWNNIERIEQRIRKTKDAIDRLSKSKNVNISPAYLNLKIEELQLVHEYNVKVHEEREEQRRIREQIREEQRILKEIGKAKREAEKEEQQYQKALERARQEAAKATGGKQAKLQAEIEKLNQQLLEAQEKNQRALSMAQQTRSGHVYVISNIGSFGENIYKIGMTRRLEPMDRVKELGDASVPFQFDVHAMIYSNDAPKLENELHRQFDTKRVNRINLRKEFFRVTLDEIRDVVNANHGEIEFTLVAEAAEFRQSTTITT